MSREAACRRIRLSPDMLRGEFIGLEAAVTSPGLNRVIRGKIIDETRNMIRLEKRGREWLVPKKGSRIRLLTIEGEIEIDGEWILGNPADRVKKRFRRSIR
jgi:RNase P/RNase MRP subunit p29